MDTEKVRLALELVCTVAQHNALAQLETAIGASTANSTMNPEATQFVSQFRLDGQPILPPLMTAEKRQEMQNLKQTALQLEEKLKNARASKLSELAESVINKKDSRSVDDAISDLVPKAQPLQDTPQTDTELLHTPTPANQKTQENSFNSNPTRLRPCTLNLELAEEAEPLELGLPTICVNPPTPQQPSLSSTTAQAALPASSSCLYGAHSSAHLLGRSRSLSPARYTSSVSFHQQNSTTRSRSLSPASSLAMRIRRLNNVTVKTIYFERNSQAGKTLPHDNETEPATVLWEGMNKRLLRSSTSPSLTNLYDANGAGPSRLLRTRSFTLDKPSQALLEHMERETGTQSSQSQLAMPVPPPLPTAPSAQTNRLHCSFAKPLTVQAGTVPAFVHLQRDTIESRAKRVQRQHTSPSTKISQSLSGQSARRAGKFSYPYSPSHMKATLHQLHEQQQVEQLLEHAMCEGINLSMDADQDERRTLSLSLAKRKMLNDIKAAHRDRFKQLIQYQHEEQRRLQLEFDRQQKFLIEEICNEINVATYAREKPSASLVSEYTSTDDLGPCSLSSRSMPSSLTHTPRTAITQTSSQVTTPSSFMGLDEFLDGSCQLNANQTALTSNSARKRLFGAQQECLTTLAADVQPHSAPATPNCATPLSQAHSHSQSQTSSPNTSLGSKQSAARRARSQVRKTVVKKLPAASSTASSMGGSCKMTNTPPNAMKNRARTTAPTVSSKTSTMTATKMSGATAQSSQRSMSKSKNTTQTRKAPVAVALAQRYAQLDDGARHEVAATRLTAAARGFLVRRLFRTEQVQRIVQTIRDTLIFVLNLHLETRGSSLEEQTPTNIRLKVRLLQQLCSASRALHLVFFQTSVKERMEIIARDRKRIKAKLAALHLKRRL